MLFSLVRVSSQKLVLLVHDGSLQVKDRPLSLTTLYVQDVCDFVVVLSRRTVTIIAIQEDSQGHSVPLQSTGRLSGLNFLLLLNSSVYIFWLLAGRITSAIRFGHVLTDHKSLLIETSTNRSCWSYLCGQHELQNVVVSPGCKEEP